MIFGNLSSNQFWKKENLDCFENWTFRTFQSVTRWFKGMDDDVSEYKVYELGPETDDFINDKGNRVQRRGDFEKDRIIVTAGCPGSPNQTRN